MGIDRKLTPRDVLFGFGGRIGRCTYAWYNLLLSVVLLTTFATSSMLTSPDGSVVGWPDVLSFPWCLILWPGSALNCKRLHDLGLSGRHVVWMVGLGAATHLAALPAVGAVASVVSSCVGLGLLLVPGTDGANPYGLRVGMTVDREAPGAMVLP